MPLRVLVPNYYFAHATENDREALEALAEPERYPLLAPLSYQDWQVLRLGSFPTFTALKTWGLLRKRDGFYARRVTWNRFGETPSLYGSEGCLPEEETRALIAELAALSLPVRPLIEPGETGRDGTTHTLTLSRAGGELALSWWEDGPPGWEALAQWHARAVELFEAHLPPTSP